MFTALHSKRSKRSKHNITIYIIPQFLFIFKDILAFLKFFSHLLSKKGTKTMVYLPILVPSLLLYVSQNTDFYFSTLICGYSTDPRQLRWLFVKNDEFNFSLFLLIHSVFHVFLHLTPLSSVMIHFFSVFPFITDVCIKYLFSTFFSPHFSRIFILYPPSFFHLTFPANSLFSRLCSIIKLSNKGRFYYGSGSKNSS